MNVPKPARRLVSILAIAISLAVHGARAQSTPTSCYANGLEVSGISVIAFATMQHRAAEICDKAYGAWTPSLADRADQVMAKSAANPSVAEFLAAVEEYAHKHNVTIHDVSQDVLNRQGHQLFPGTPSRGFCDEVSRGLERRYSSQDELISTAVLDAARAKEKGYICGTSPPAR